MKQPTAFVETQGGQYRPSQSASYNTFDHIPPPPVDLLPTLRVAASPLVARATTTKYRAYLSQALVQRLGLRSAQPANLLPPSNSKYWYLDLRPEAGRSIKWYADTRPRIECLSLPTGLVLPNKPLILELLPGEPPYPGFYLLQPQH